ncbi:MAG: TonB-dependent receptor plug domain-containing protein [Opitutaceae bacterium]|nr:TonB-dependent receptor plug domain-containing protein [Opitutaceae bacterium]
MRRALSHLRLILVLAGAAAGWLRAAPVAFDIPAQGAADALLAFSAQARTEVLFSFDELQRARSTAVTGALEPEEALARLLSGTGFIARRNRAGKFVATRISPPAGAIRGRLLTADEAPAPGVLVGIPGTPHQATTDRTGTFLLAGLPAATYRLRAAPEGFRPVEFATVPVESEKVTILPPHRLEPVETPTLLEPYLVEGQSTRRESLNRAELAPRVAIGNLDLPRTENDALPYRIISREKLARSGVVDLNQFLQRELLDADASTLPLDQRGNQSSFLAGSTNLNLRGFGADATVILVNGRRLPESAATESGYLSTPDVNFIPLSLVQQVEVLPVSASALYTGSPVGGVINIVLRPDFEATEVTTTYTNATGDFDAPQASVSLQHGRTLADGRVRLRFNASGTRTQPATEAELGFRRANLQTPADPGISLYRATPNVRSADLTPLFGPGSAAVTSVAPGADGTGGLAAFAGREGVRSLGLFDSAGGLAVAPDSQDQPYGRRQARTSFFGSVVWDVVPRLQVGLDAVYTRTTVNRGFDVISGDLVVAAGAPANPFGRDVIVSLNETATALGEDYSEAQLELFSAVAGVLVRLPGDWSLSGDAQYTRNVAEYRGLAGVDAARWQELVDTGAYNPFRDTQVHAPPAEFYARALRYYGFKDRFTTVGDYETIDTAARVTNQSLPLPTGLSSFTAGADYRVTALADYTEAAHFADGTLSGQEIRWRGRTLERVSAFGELQAPLLPAHRLPAWLRLVEAEFAVRYVVSDLAREANVAPTVGLKADFANGWSGRVSFTTANRYPASAMSRPIQSGGGGGPGVNYAYIYDPVRNENYNVETDEDPNPAIVTEAAVTQTAGVIYQRGGRHRLRAALDFVDTRKTNELLYLDPQMVINLDALFPGRISRAPLPPGSPQPAGLITSLVTGPVNSSWRHSQNWNAALDYAWNECLGGTLEAHGRLVYFQRYRRQVLASSPVVDQFAEPDGSATGLMRWRANYGVAWSNRRWGLGVDGHYYHRRLLPALEWASQGDRTIAGTTQYDVYVEGDLARLGRWLGPHGGLRAQVRVNNVLDAAFPRYANDPSGAGVQPYGDWRGRTVSLSLTATF